MESRKWEIGRLPGARVPARETGFGLSIFTFLFSIFRCKEAS
jgi:hypothetical protein